MEWLAIICGASPAQSARLCWTLGPPTPTLRWTNRRYPVVRGMCPDLYHLVIKGRVDIIGRSDVLCDVTIIFTLANEYCTFNAILQSLSISRDSIAVVGFNINGQLWLNCHIYMASERAYHINSMMDGVICNNSTVGREKYGQTGDRTRNYPDSGRAYCHCTTQPVMWRNYQLQHQHRVFSRQRPLVQER
jgi:hypothetical protein